MEIKTGKKFLCIRDVVMYNSNITEYNKGKVYTSEMDGCITDNSGAAHHQWKMVETTSQYFQPLEEAKWAIRRTSENYEEINEWANANSLDEAGYYTHDGLWFHSHGVLEGRCPRLHFNLQDGFTEIDTEAFREITEYLKSAEKIRTYQPKWGEKIEVSDDGENWYNRTFVGFNPNNTKCPYIVCNDVGWPSNYRYGRHPIQEKTFTMQEAIEALAKEHNLRVDQVKIKY